MNIKMLLICMFLVITFSEVALSHQEPIHMAIVNGDVQQVAEIIKLGVDVELPTNNERKDSPLQYAIELEQIKIVELLLENGANPNKLNGIGYAPIHASTDVSIDILKMIVKHGGDVNLRAANGTSVLQTAMQDENVEAFQYLLKKAADPNGMSSLEQPIICAAAYYEVPDYITLLVKHGAELNHTKCKLNPFEKESNVEFVAPIHFEKCDLNRIKIFESLGANKDIKSSKGRTLLQLAKEVEDGWDNGKDCSQSIRYLSK